MKKYSFLGIVAAALIVLCGSVSVVRATGNGNVNFESENYTVSAGQNVRLPIFITGGPDFYDSAQIRILYENDELQLVNFDAAGSALTLAGVNEFKSSDMTLLRGNPNPLKGTRYFGAVTFKLLKTSGSTVVSFDNLETFPLRSGSTITSDYNYATITAKPVSQPPTSPTTPNDSTSPGTNVNSTSEQSLDYNKLVEKAELERVGLNTAHFSIETSQNTIVEVAFGEDKDSKSTKVTTESYGTIHDLLIDHTELKPVTTYYYQFEVTTEDGITAVSEELEFTTFGYDLDITVLDDDAKITNATVEINDQREQTGEDGVASFTDLAVGEYEVRVIYDDTDITQRVAVQDYLNTETNDVEKFQVLPQYITIDTAVDQSGGIINATTPAKVGGLPTLRTVIIAILSFFAVGGVSVSAAYIVQHLRQNKQSYRGV